MANNIFLLSFLTYQFGTWDFVKIDVTQVPALHSIGYLDACSTLKREREETAPCQHKRLVRGGVIIHIKF